MRIPAVFALMLRGMTLGALLLGGMAHAQEETAPPETNYPALAARIEATLQAALYAEEAFTHPRTQYFLLELKEGAKTATTHQAFLEPYRENVDRLPFSHLEFRTPERAEQARGEPAAPADNVSLSEAAEGVMMLTIRSFGRFTLDEAEDVFEQITEVAPKALLIDLRENRGGNYSSGYVAAHLTAEERSSGTLFARPARAAVLNGQRDQFPSIAVNDLKSVEDLAAAIQKNGAFTLTTRPLAPRYDGPVYVLTSHNTASANEPLVDSLKRAGRVTVVGESTHGAMLSADWIDVGQGWQMFTPVLDYVNEEGARLDLRGVAPDVQVPADRAVEAALAHIAERSSE